MTSWMQGFLMIDLDKMYFENYFLITLLLFLLPKHKISIYSWINNILIFNNKYTLKKNDPCLINFHYYACIKNTNFLY